MVDFPKVAFIGWNPFQFLHVKDLASSIHRAIFIIEKEMIMLKLIRSIDC